MRQLIRAVELEAEHIQRCEHHKKTGIDMGDPNSSLARRLTLGYLHTVDSVDREILLYDLQMPREQVEHWWQSRPWQKWSDDDQHDT